MDILEQMVARAKANPQRIVLPEGDEPRTLEAANILLRDKIAQLILIGNPEKIKGMAAEKGYEFIKEAKIIDPIHDPKMPQYANLLFELRKAKGMTEEEAAKKAQDNRRWFIHNRCLTLYRCLCYCTSSQHQW